IISSGNGIKVQHNEKTTVLDPSTPADANVTFISHAHMDHMHRPNSNSILLTSRETAYLASQRGNDLGTVKNELEGYELVNSGHILGSRGLVIEDDLYYTGDIAGRARGFLPKGKAVKCKTLIIESTFGEEEYRFPPTSVIQDKVNKLISELFSKGIPVLLMGYALGKAQMVSYLFSSWQPMYSHNAVFKMNEAHRSLNVDLKTEPMEYARAAEEGFLDRKPWILVTSLTSGRTDYVRKLKEKYGVVTIGFSGWAVNENYKHSMALDYAFPLSDHCDFQELVALVKECEPERVFTVHGSSVTLAEHLRKIGFEAEPLLNDQQSLKNFM
ncbi:MAG: MBL fold metallo-hydrolase RNA specificity domain-containing protein, partial [Nitrososphaerales archaeon]